MHTQRSERRTRGQQDQNREIVGISPAGVSKSYEAQPQVWFATDQNQDSRCVLGFSLKIPLQLRLTASPSV